MITTLNNKLDVLRYAQTGKFVIYGAGQVGITLLRYLAANDLIDSVLNFAVTDITKEPEEIMGVPVYSAEELPADSRVLIAVHPNLHDEIAATLTDCGIADVTGVGWDCYLQMRRTIHDFSTEQLLGKRHFSLGRIYKILEEITQLSEVVAANTAAFTEYENAFEGRDVVLLGTGPSLNRYKPIDGAIHIGVNRAYKFEKVKLDFLFVCDFRPDILCELYGESGLQNCIDDLKKLDCKKFIGNYLNQTICNISEKHFKDIDGVRYFLNSDQSTRMYCNIKNRPLAGWSSVVFAAMNFALFCHPKKIFIVGCDGYSPNNSIYFNTPERYKGGWLKGGYTIDDWLSGFTKNNVAGWKKVKEFASIYYPDIEIISINPISLKGLFKDMEM